jgi:hypothetical protein
MWIGISLSSYLGDILQRRTQTAWQESAQLETSRQGAVLRGWIEECLTTLSGLVLLVESMPTLDAATFDHAVHGMEMHTAVQLISSQAVLDYQAGA